MQQVPAVEIDGITLSQSVSPLILVFLNLNFCEILEYLCKIHANTVGSDPVHRWNASGASTSSSWPKETRSGSDDQWPHCIRNSASAGKHWASQMIDQRRSWVSVDPSPPHVSELARDSEGGSRKSAVGSALHQSRLSRLGSSFPHLSQLLTCDTFSPFSSSSGASSKGNIGDVLRGWRGEVWSTIPHKDVT